MVKSVFDVVMERRARQLLEQVGEWLPAEGPFQILRRDLVAAGLRIRARRERPVLPDRSLVVARWNLVRGD